MSHGLPVIASRIGGLPEFVSDGISGQLFEPGNIDELTRAIRLLWDQPDLCQQMGNAGRARAMNEFNDALYYQRLVDAYELAIQLAGRPRTRSRQVIPDRDRGLRCVSVK
jgi:glycosyltransferase involved in cell wall biosynthesis